MKLYLLSQTENNEYDTYDSAIVAAENEDAARITHPSGDPAHWANEDSEYGGTWCDASLVTVKEIGLAHPDIAPGVVLASFNAV